MSDSPYVPQPLESMEAANKFVAHGKETCGEDVFAIEEAAEYIRALCKLRRIMFRDKDRLTSWRTDVCKEDLAEEIAHVYLTLNHVRLAYDIPLTLIQAAMDRKIEEYDFSDAYY